MTFLATNELEQRQLVQGAGMGPGTFEVGGPAAFEGFGTATATGIGRGLATTGAVLNEASRYSPAYRLNESLSDLFGVGDTFRENQATVDEAIRGAVDYYRLDPATTGFAGQISYGVGATLLPAIIGTAVAGPAGGAILAGGAVGTGTFVDMTGEGVDRDTALRAAGIDALATGLGVLAPASLGASLLTKAATGAGVNLALGAGQRYAMGEYLRGAGYGEIAARYDALDATAIATDAILGAAFGVLPGGRRPSQQAVDAAMVSRSARHTEVDVAPGIPADPAAINAHVRAVDTAEAALLRGEPVRVEAMVRGARFAPKPDAPMPEVAALVQELDSLGFAQLVGDIRELEAELQGRGRTFDEDALPDVAAIPRAEPAARTMAETAPTPEPPAVISDLGDGLYEIKSRKGKLLGNALIEEGDTALTIRGVELDAGSRGQGIGMAVYRQILDRAFAEGKVLASDSEVTTDAARIYDALERRGFTIERNPAAKLGDDAKWRTPDESPVFTVTRGPEPTDGAAQPTSGAQGAEGRAAAPENRAADEVVAQVLAEKPDMQLPASVVRAVLGDLTPERVWANLVRWFGDSKVVDENGKPLVVYHGTDRDSFDVFNTDNPRAWAPDEVGAFFTSSRRNASTYGKRIVEVYLAIKNPLEVSDADWSAGGVMSPRQARDAGFDGYIIRGQDGADTYVAFDSKQIKSATGNSGLYDPNSGSLTDALAAADELVDRATIDSAAYQAAVNCFLRNG